MKDYDKIKFNSGNPKGPFEVPEGYFQELENKMVQKFEAKSAHKHLVVDISRFRKIAAALVLCIAATFAIWKQNDKVIIADDLDFQEEYFAYELEDLDDELLYEMTENVDEDYDAEIEYLIDNDIDFESLITQI